MVSKGSVRGQSSWIKVPNLFCIYQDPSKFPEITYSSHTPCILEIEYKENEIQLGKKAYSEHSFDCATKKITTNKKHKVDDSFVINEFVQKRKTEIQYLLLPFADIFVFDYPRIQGWFIDKSIENGQDFKCKYGQLFYHQADIDLADKKELTILVSEEYEKYSQYIWNPGILTSRKKDSSDFFDSRVEINLSDMFNTFFELPLDSPVRKGVLSASRQYHKSKSFDLLDKTARFLHCVSAIETLIETENHLIRCDKCKEENKHLKNCKECKKLRENETCTLCRQKVFSVNKKFHAFIEKYSNNYNEKDVKNVYELRSSIVHTGNYFSNYGFFLYDDDNSQEDYKQEYLNDHLFKIIDNIVKEVIKKYLFCNSDLLQKTHEKLQS